MYEFEITDQRLNGFYVIPYHEQMKLIFEMLIYAGRFESRIFTLKDLQNAIIAQNFVGKWIVQKCSNYSKEKIRTLVIAEIEKDIKEKKRPLRGALTEKNIESCIKKYREKKSDPIVEEIVQKIIDWYGHPHNAQSIQEIMQAIKEDKVAKVLITGVRSVYASPERYFSVKELSTANNPSALIKDPEICNLAQQFTKTMVDNVPKEDERREMMNAVWEEGSGEGLVKIYNDACNRVFEIVEQYTQKELKQSSSLQSLAIPTCLKNCVSSPQALQLNAPEQSTECQVISVDTALAEELVTETAKLQV